MNNRITRHRARRGRMIAFFDANNSLIQGFDDIRELKDLFLTNSAQWEDQAATIVAMSENTNAASKKQALENMGFIACKWGQRCKIQARNAGLNTVALQLDHEKSDFTHLDAAASIDLAITLRNALNDNMAAFAKQGVTPAVIAQIDAAVDAAKTMRDTPVTENKNLISLNAQQAEGDASLELQLEDLVTLLSAEYSDTNNDFVTAMQLQYTLGGDTGKRHTGIEGTVKDAAGNGQKGYTIRRADDSTKVSITDADGAYTIKGMKGGEVSFELLSPAGAVVATKDLKLKLGTVVVWDWEV